MNPKPRKPILRRMVPRDPTETGRTATPLELLSDLCFAVAVAQAATSLHHGVSEGHGAHGAVSFGLVFFAIWWAWIGFAWFGSAFDTDDPLYRANVFLQIVGVLVLAAGVPRAFEHLDYFLVTIGYAILRVGLLSQWLRAAKGNPEIRKTAVRHAVGITTLQVSWLALLWVPSELWIRGWLVLAPLELLIPWWAERAGETSWHPHHIAERYGLFTIIVIGESVLAATAAIQTAIDLREIPGDLVSIIVGAPVILFAMWWLYFSRPGHRLLTSNRAAFFWGYGHYFIFASAAAVGAGVAVLADQAIGQAHLTDLWAGEALAIPVSIYLLSVWLIQLRRGSSARLERVACPGTAALVLAAPLTEEPVLIVALLLALLTISTVVTGSAQAPRGPGVASFRSGDQISPAQSGESGKA